MEDTLEKTHQKKYESYKDSGVEWLGEVPEHWTITSLGSLIEHKSNKGHSDLKVLSVYRDYGVILKDSRDDNHNATSLDTSTYKAVEPGDLVVNKMKAWQGSMGISDYKGIVSPSYITCRVTTNKIESIFLHRLLRSYSYIGEYNRISYGVRIGQWDMRYEDFKKVPVLIPPKDEQDRIISFLDKKTSQIELLIANRRKIIERLFELIKVFVLTGCEKAKRIPETKDWLSSYPEQWNTEKAKHIFYEKDQKNYPDKELLAVTQDRGIIFKADSEKNYVSPSGDFSGLKLVSNNDYVISLRSFQGGIETSDIEGIVSPAYNVFHLKKKYADKTLQTFYKYLFKTPRFINMLDSLVSSIRDGKNISYDDFSNLRIPVPEPRQIKFILSYIERYEKAKKAFREEEKRLLEYKKILINSVVTGKIKI